MKYFSSVLFLLLFLNSCIVQSPKYTSLEKVLSLQLGMSKVQVEETLGIKPYDIKSFTDSGNAFIYVYRVIDRRTISFDTKPTNGKEAIGKYLQLSVTFSNENKITKIEACNSCSDISINTKKLDFQKLLAFFTITLPVILVFIGLN